MIGIVVRVLVVDREAEVALVVDHRRRAVHEVVLEEDRIHARDHVVEDLDQKNRIEVEIETVLDLTAAVDVADLDPVHALDNSPNNTHPTDDNQLRVTSIFFRNN